MTDLDMNELMILDNQLCFALYAASREVIKKYKPYLDKLGITYTQYVTLLALWEKDNVTVKDLGKKLHLDSGTLTPLLKKLEQMKYLDRIRDSKDERNVYVSLTKEGRNLREKAIDVPIEIIKSLNLDVEESADLRDKVKNFLRYFT